MRARAIAIVIAALTVPLLVTGIPRQRPAAAGPAELARVSFVTTDGGSVLIHGTYPAPSATSPCVHHSASHLHARFAGTVEIGRASDGSLFVIDVLSFEDYVDGIGEVPRTWPIEALRAQAIAARSYAMASIAHPDPTGRALGYQLCATDHCQVYSGLAVADGPYGNRWRHAVSSTAGQVLLFHGSPATTFYFSTSNGHTYGNETVFGGSPLPYLRPVTEHDDGTSPVSRWKATIPLPDVTRFLREAGSWTPSAAVGSVATSGDDVVLHAKGSPATHTMSKDDFRSDIDAWGPCLDPDRYPGTNGVNGTGLPQAVPSHWFTASTKSGSVVVSGRGWGHGVGLVQWGAYGKAKRGLDASQILADYYGGLRPAVDPSEPDEIRIGIATGLRSVQVAPTGSVQAQGTDVTTGPWTVRGGKQLTVTTGGTPPTYLSPGSLTSAAKHARDGHALRATLSLPQLAVVHLVLVGRGESRSISPSVTEQAGRVELSGTVPADTVTGTYTVKAEVTNGTDIVRTPGRKVAIAGIAAPPSPSPSPRTSADGSPLALSPSSGRSVPWLPIGATAGVLVALGVSAVAVRRRRPSSQVPAAPGR